MGDNEKVENQEGRGLMNIRPWLREVNCGYNILSW